MIAINRKMFPERERRPALTVFECPECGRTTRPFERGFIMCRHVWDSVQKATAEEVRSTPTTSGPLPAPMLGLPVYLWEELVHV